MIEKKDQKKYDENTISQHRSSLEKTVAIVYMFEVQKIPIDINSVFEDFDMTIQELRKLELVAKYYDFFRENIVKLLTKGWSWNRLSSLIRAILLVGSLELFITNKALIINEMVAITKEYTLEEHENDYKFVNSLLDKLSEKYEEIKKSN